MKETQNTRETQDPLTAKEHLLNLGHEQELINQFAEDKEDKDDDEEGPQR